MSKCKAKWW